MVLGCYRDMHNLLIANGQQLKPLIKPLMIFSPDDLIKVINDELRRICEPNVSEPRIAFKYLEWLQSVSNAISNCYACDRSALIDVEDSWRIFVYDMYKPAIKRMKRTCGNLSTPDLMNTTINEEIMILTLKIKSFAKYMKTSLDGINQSYPRWFVFSASLT